MNGRSHIYFRARNVNNRRTNTKKATTTKNAKVHQLCVCPRFVIVSEFTCGMCVKCAVCLCVCVSLHRRASEWVFVGTTLAKCVRQTSESSFVSSPPPPRHDHRHEDDAGRRAQIRLIACAHRFRWQPGRESLTLSRALSCTCERASVRACLHVGA